MANINFSFEEQQPLGRQLQDPKGYLMPPGLAKAVEVALILGQPLLLTGEPGTGKTQLAYRVAQDLAAQNAHFRGEPLVFHTKTTSTASDLFYLYDAVRHFHDASLAKTAGGTSPDVANYISLQAYGLALALSNPQEVATGRFLPKGSTAQGTVVLIDEIDKAPRDFPNDLLHELENQSFQIREAGNYEIECGEKAKILVLLTSNSEKNLPDAFLRRCVYFHIPFPEGADLVKIVQSRLSSLKAENAQWAVRKFQEIRARAQQKPPATAELLAWVKVLELQGFFKENLDKLSAAQEEQLRFSYSVLLKNKEDLEGMG